MKTVTPFVERYSFNVSPRAGVGTNGILMLDKKARVERQTTLSPHMQNTTGLTPSISTRALIQPVLLAPIVVYGENLFIVWPDNRTSVSQEPDFDEAHLPAFKNTGHANWDIFFVRSYDHGQTFTEPINLSNSTNGTSIGAEIAVHDRDPNHLSVYVTFWDNKTGENTPYFVFSNDGGIKFGKPVMLNVTTIR